MKMSITTNKTDAALEQKIQEIEATIPEDRTPIGFQKLEEIIHKWLLIKDRGLIRVLTAAVIANRLEGDPVWIFIIAAPGGTKTELIRGLGKIDGIYPISDLTPQTFLSGEKGNKKASLLFRLPKDNTILTYKDFTTVLTMHRDKRHAILSQLREIYDGSYSKEFGTGETKAWEGKLGFIAGVTSIIDTHQSVFQVLGERFIQYRPKQPNCIALAKKAMANSGGEKQMREEIENAFADFIAGVQMPEGQVRLSDEITNRIAHLATLCVKARSGVIREGYSSREIDLIPDSELPTRLAKVLNRMFVALSLIEGNSTEDNFELIYKIGMDLLPKKRKKALDELVRINGGELETATVATAIGYPTNTTRRILEDLHGLGLANRQHEGQGSADRWSVKKYTMKLLEKAHPSMLQNSINKSTNDTLPEKSEEPKIDLAVVQSFFDKSTN